MACKKETKSPAAQPANATPVSYNHYYYKVVGVIAYDSGPIGGDSVAIKVNNKVILTMNRQQLGITGYSFVFNCKSGDNMSIYENPGKSSSGSTPSGGIKVYLSDTGGVYQYSVVINPCACVINDNLFVR